jgi:hypothetical protein
MTAGASINSDTRMLRDHGSSRKNQMVSGKMASRVMALSLENRASVYSDTAPTSHFVLLLSR